MVLMITVIAIVVAFSLYDYFQSRSWQSITSSKRNEEVFENRNKKYGAYQIRRDYDKRLVLIMLSMFIGLGGLWGATRLFKADLKNKNEGKVVVENIAELFKSDEKPLDEPEKQQTEEAPKQNLIEQTKFVAPVVTDSTLHDADIKIPDGEKQVGDKDIKGDPTDIFNTGIPNDKKGEGDTKLIETKDKFYTELELTELAEYPGGIGEMRKFIANHIDLSAVDGGSKMYMKFVVDEKGEISRVAVTKATKECESCEQAAIKVIKQMPKWKPGKINGEPVKSYFRIPITIME